MKTDPPPDVTIVESGRATKTFAPGSTDESTVVVGTTIEQPSTTAIIPIRGSQTIITLHDPSEISSVATFTSPAQGLSFVGSGTFINPVLGASVLDRPIRLFPSGTTQPIAEVNFSIRFTLAHAQVRLHDDPTFDLVDPLTEAFRRFRLDAFDAITQRIFIEGADPFLAQETLRTLGRISDPGSVEARSVLTSEALRSKSPGVRHAATLAAIRLATSTVLAALQEAIDREPIPALKADMKKLAATVPPVLEADHLMAKLLRQIERSVEIWYAASHPHWEAAQQLQADLLNELRTKENTLSVWQVEDDDQARRLLAMLALQKCRGGDGKQSLKDDGKYFFFDSALLEDLAVSVDSSKRGKVQDPEVAKWHRDIINLTADKLVAVATELVRIAQPQTIRYEDLLVELRNRELDGTIPKDAITARVREQIEELQPPA